MTEPSPTTLPQTSNSTTEKRKDLEKQATNLAKKPKLDLKGFECISPSDSQTSIILLISNYTHVLLLLTRGGPTLSVAFEKCSKAMFSYMTDLKYVEIDPKLDRKIRVEDPEGFRVEAKARGEKFSLSKHVQGTEIKAITYSNLQVHQKDGRVDIYVIVDI